MQITHLSLAGRGAWPDLEIKAINPQLNVFYGPPRTGKSTIAQLVGHLLYGKQGSTWRQQFAQTIPQTAGSLEVNSSAGNYVLRRHSAAEDSHSAVWRAGHDQSDQLTIAANDGSRVNDQTVRSLLFGLKPAVAMQLFAVDFAEQPHIESLLSESFAREFTYRNPVNTSKKTLPISNRTCCNSPNTSPVEAIDHLRVEELIGQRDEIAKNLEHHVGVCRRESDVLEIELRDLKLSLENKNEQAHQIRAKLRGVEVELSELDTRLRYLTLRSRSPNKRNTHKSDLVPHQLAQLDKEITTCRRTLAGIQSQVNATRTKLAQSNPDGTADRVTCLDDSRTVLGSVEQLLDELDSEVAQLASANEPSRCVGHDAHARLTPVTRILREQIYTLCGQLTEQERIFRCGQLNTELRQLERLQGNMGERLDLLLANRETFVRQDQQAGTPVFATPQTPVPDHCCCDHHGPFVSSSDVQAMGSTTSEGDMHARRDAIEHNRTLLLDELNALTHDIEQAEGRWKELQKQRMHLMGGTVFKKQQDELERLEKMIAGILQPSLPQASHSKSASWRASDVLAQLTNGNLVQIRLEWHHRRALVIDKGGRALSTDKLSKAQHDQLYLALTLALVNSYAQQGIQLPLVLDEPFLRQDEGASLIMAGVLEEFAQAGHQVLAFTEDHRVQNRFTGLGAEIFDLVELRRHQRSPSVATTFADAIATANNSPLPTSTKTRVVREPLDGSSTPNLRLAKISDSNPGNELFTLSKFSSWDEFPILGRETEALFEIVGIRSVGDLLAAAPEKVAQQICQPDITQNTVRLWQVHIGLMCNIPNVTIHDAQLLAAVGVKTPSDLCNANLGHLLQSIETFLSSSRGQRFALTRERIRCPKVDRLQLNNWQDGALRHRNRWLNYLERENKDSSIDSQDVQQHPAPRDRQPDSKKQQSKKHSPEQKLFFTLNCSNDVEAAPSIGPKTADRLAQVGIRSVADLLSANPESVAEELDTNHINAKMVASWQQQARLVCQIPQLPGYGAQLLVASGFTDPEQLANTSVDVLVGKVLSICKTKKGQRIMRSGDAPERDKIAKWIECAAHRRPLEAA